MTILFFLWLIIAGALCVAAAMAITILPILAMSSTHPWFCNRLGWHRNRDIEVSPLVHDIGLCKRCNKMVSKDTFGNWV